MKSVLNCKHLLKSVLVLRALLNPTVPCRSLTSFIAHAAGGDGERAEGGSDGAAGGARGGGGGEERRLWALQDHGPLAGNEVFRIIVSNSLGDLPLPDTQLAARVRAGHQDQVNGWVEGS